MDRQSAGTTVQALKAMEQSIFSSKYSNNVTNITTSTTNIISKNVMIFIVIALLYHLVSMLTLNKAGRNTMKSFLLPWLI
jgi:hypothetical protein